jgi:hypothetical protein
MNVTTIPAPITAKINLLLASLRIFWQSIKSLQYKTAQPRTQGLSSWRAKTLVDAGHVIC